NPMRSLLWTLSRILATAPTAGRSHRVNGGSADSAAGDVTDRRKDHRLLRSSPLSHRGTWCCKVYWQRVTLQSPGMFARWSECGFVVTARVLGGRLHAGPCRASQVCGA